MNVDDNVDDHDNDDDYNEYNDDNKDDEGNEDEDDNEDDGDEEYMRIDSSLIFFWTDSKRLFRGSQSNMTEEKWHWKISPLSESLLPTVCFWDY